MTPAELRALRAMDASMHTLQWATSHRQSGSNLNATVARNLALKGLIQPAPDWLARAVTGCGCPWILTDEGHQALEEAP